MFHYIIPYFPSHDLYPPPLSFSALLCLGFVEVMHDAVRRRQIKPPSRPSDDTAQELVDSISAGADAGAGMQGQGSMRTSARLARKRLAGAAHASREKAPEAAEVEDAPVTASWRRAER